MNSTQHGIDLANCIHSAMHIGFTRYHNVCTSAVTDVPWGAGDWVLWSSLAFVFFGLGMMAVGLCVVMIRDVFE